MVRKLGMIYETHLFFHSEMVNHWGLSLSSWAKKKKYAHPAVINALAIITIRQRSTLNRTRLENVPPPPANLHHVALNGVWVVTLTNDQYLVHQDNQNDILVFATDDDFQLLDNTNYVYLNGNFKSALRLYLQFVTIHGRVNDLDPAQKKFTCTFEKVSHA